MERLIFITLVGPTVSQGSLREGDRRIKDTVVGNGMTGAGAEVICKGPMSRGMQVTSRR